VDDDAGFTAGIKRLMDIFEGSTLRVLETVYIADQECDLFVSLWSRGIGRRCSMRFSVVIGLFFNSK